MDKQARCEAANRVIDCIAGCGRRFFYNDAYDLTSRFEVDIFGQLFFIDCATGRRIHNMYDLPGGEKSRALAWDISDYINDGTLVPFSHFEQEWGYGQAMQTVREGAMQTGVVAKK